MRRRLVAGLWAAALTLSAPHRGAAQVTPPTFLPVGTMAPDFALPGATRYGLLSQPVRLSDFRGNTVVLAFYFRVRGGG